MLISVRVLCRELLHDGIKKVTCAATIGCRDAVYLSKTERIELECIIHLLT